MLGSTTPKATGRRMKTMSRLMSSFPLVCLDCRKKISVGFYNWPEANEEEFFKVLRFLFKHSGHRIEWTKPIETSEFDEYQEDDAKVGVG